MKVEVGQYRELKKPGALKAFFTLCIYDETGDADRQYTDCQYFVVGERQWWTFAQKVVKAEDGSKPKYFPYTKYMKRSYADQMQETVLKQLQTRSKESNEQSYSTQNYSQSNPSTQNDISPSAPFGW